MAWVIKTFHGLTDTAPAADLNQFRTNLDTHLKLHTHSGTAGDGGELGLGLDYLQLLPFFPASNTGFATRGTNSSAQFGGYLTTDDNNQGNSASFYVNLRPGTWRLDMLHRKNSAYGIITVTVGATSFGTIDGYDGGSPTYNEESSLTGVAYAGSPVNSGALLTLSMATKNASSSGYGALIQMIVLRRTGA